MNAAPKAPSPPPIRLVREGSWSTPSPDIHIAEGTSPDTTGAILDTNSADNIHLVKLFRRIRQEVARAKSCRGTGQLRIDFDLSGGEMTGTVRIHPDWSERL
jgi:hypothetical protein